MCKPRGARDRDLWLLIPLLAGCLVCTPGALGQVAMEFSSRHRQQGYCHQADVTYFLFDPQVYAREQPSRVVVTGAFRGWDQNMEEPRWQLQPAGTPPALWVLAVPNAGYREIAPSTSFKFRVDDGVWLDPPAAASNRDGGNLVFEPDVVPLRLRAELRGPRAISVQLTGYRGPGLWNARDFRLMNATGDEIGIEAVIPRTSTESLIVPGTGLDWRRVYYLEIPSLSRKALCRRDHWFRTLYSAKALGAEISADRRATIFRLFAPRADRVVLYLYDGPDDLQERSGGRMELQRDGDGVWEVSVPGDLHGSYYDFTVHGPADPGNSFHETHPVHVSDPYARVSVDSFGKCRVWRRTAPARPLPGGRPRMEDVIAYEVHVQDFTQLLPVEESLQGTIPAMTLAGLRNSQGESIGFDYLVDLGINVVHLMPVQEFLHFPDAEWQAAFREDPFMQAHGVHLENYEWGYRTTHAFAVETRYRRRGSEHGAQRDQFRDLVQAFHDQGIAVIIDIVPNHTGENMDGRNYLFNFNAIDRPYYFRTDDKLEHIGPFGNEVKTEDRPMVQRWLIDQCRHFIEEFGIDGFRIDLAGQIDKPSLQRLRRELGEDVIIYGEPWIAPSDPEVAGNAEWSWYKEDAPITFFQDDARNAFKGPTSNPRNKATDRGFAGGDGSQRERVMQALRNSFPDEGDPNRGINYLDIHDNWALADQFATKDWDGRLGVDEGPYKIAAGLLFTSLGPIVLHGGTEIMRSKGAAPLQETVKYTASGPLAFHGKRDTYNCRTANLFVWENVGKTRRDPQSANDYRNMLAYWKGLMAFRRSDAGKVFRVGTAPPPDYYRWLLPDNPQLLGYLVDERVLVLLNTSGKPGDFAEVELPAGTWRLIANGQVVDHVGGVEDPDGSLRGGARHDLRIPPTSLKIWLRQ